MFRSRPGDLPADGPAEVGGVTLPPGHRLTADGGTPIGWITDGPLAAGFAGPLVRRLIDAFPSTGLWPLLCPPDPTFDDLGWFRGPDLRDLDPVDVLTERSAYATADVAEFDEDDLEDVVPPWPGPADMVPGPEPTAGQLQVDQEGKVALVAVARPADVPMATGWLGATNYDFVGAPVTAVLRSWEDRFGATLIGIGGDTLYVQAGRLPSSPEQLARLAGEHYAFCPDTVDQGIPWGQYLEWMPRQAVWTFWWD